MISDLVVGHSYVKSELEEICGVRFGYQINGIVVRRTSRKSPERLILLFQRSNGPYPDVIDKGDIEYIGAGLKGDQSLSGVNRVLADRGPIDGVYFFHQPASSAEWKYLGYGKAEYTGDGESNGRRLLKYLVRLSD